MFGHHFHPRHAARDEAGPHGPGRGRHSHHHGPGGPHGGGRDRSRVFEHGDLRLVVMALLQEAPRHGYEIIKVLEERVGGGYSPSPGVIYPTLTLLEELGHAVIREEHGGRKLYTLSPEGLAYLAANRAAADAILARIGGDDARRGPPAPVIRALENLNTAVRLRLKGQAASAEAIRDIAAAIDAAATAVEQS